MQSSFLHICQHPPTVCVVCHAVPPPSKPYRVSGVVPVSITRCAVLACSTISDLRAGFSVMVGRNYETSRVRPGSGQTWACTVSRDPWEKFGLQPTQISVFVSGLITREWTRIFAFSRASLPRPSASRLVQDSANFGTETYVHQNAVPTKR